MREITSSASPTLKVGPLRLQVITENLVEIYGEIYCVFLLSFFKHFWTGFTINEWVLKIICNTCKFSHSL